MQVKLRFLLSSIKGFDITIGIKSNNHILALKITSFPTMHPIELTEVFKTLILLPRKINVASDRVVYLQKRENRGLKSVLRIQTLIKTKFEVIPPDI